MNDRRIATQKVASFSCMFCGENPSLFKVMRAVIKVTKNTTNYVDVVGKSRDMLRPTDRDICEECCKSIDQYVDSPASQDSSS